MGRLIHIHTVAPSQSPSESLGKTRSSPQWGSGRSTTRHNALNLWSPIYDPSVWGTCRSGWAHSVARLCIPNSSPLTHMVYFLPFWSYLAGPKSVSVRPSVPPTRWQIPLLLRRAAKRNVCHALWLSLLCVALLILPMEIPPTHHSYVNSAKFKYNHRFNQQSAVCN